MAIYLLRTQFAQYFKGDGKRRHFNTRLTKSRKLLRSWQFEIVILCVNCVTVELEVLFDMTCQMVTVEFPPNLTSNT